jgi:hypothetical protein
LSFGNKSPLLKSQTANILIFDSCNGNGALLFFINFAAEKNFRKKKQQLCQATDN